VAAEKPLARLASSFSQVSLQQQPDDAACNGVLGSDITSLSVSVLNGRSVECGVEYETAEAGRAKGGIPCSGVGDEHSSLFLGICADVKCEVINSLWSRGSWTECFVAEDYYVWWLPRSPLLAWQAHSHRYLSNNNLTTLPTTVFSDLTAHLYL
jgi:hypothetical protein